MKSRPLTALLLTALTLTACGQVNPARPARALGGNPAGGSRLPVAAPVSGLVEGAAPTGTASSDPRASAVLAAVAQMRQQARASDMRITLTCQKDGGKTTRSRTHLKFRAPSHVMLEVLESSTPKVAGTRLLWKGGSQVTVKTQFVGFWVTVPLDVSDERVRDDRGYSLEQTSIPRTLDTLLHPQAVVTWRAEAQQGGRLMDVLDVVSPGRLAPTTREVYGIDRATRTPILREMYQGDRVIHRMQVDQVTVNPTFTARDFTLE
ncbi:MAG: hypothetical protein VKS61_01050 [Candidatus Sericytochromatia bacterium]|nr:hypothetical protein [Candidatus Sericytochromatia bacterium]